MDKSLIVKEVEFLNQLQTSYGLRAAGASHAFETIAEVALDIEGPEEMLRHLEVLSEHSHLEDKHPDFWLGEKEFYDLAKRLFNGLNNIRKENNNGR